MLVITWISLPLIQPIIEQRESIVQSYSSSITNQSESFFQPSTPFFSFLSHSHYSPAYTKNALLSVLRLATDVLVGSIREMLATLGANLLAVLCQGDQRVEVYITSCFMAREWHSDTRYLSKQQKRMQQVLRLVKTMLWTLLISISLYCWKCRALRFMDWWRRQCSTRDVLQPWSLTCLRRKLVLGASRSRIG